MRCGCIKISHPGNHPLHAKSRYTFPIHFIARRFMRKPRYSSARNRFPNKNNSRPDNHCWSPYAFEIEQRQVRSKTPQVRLQKVLRRARFESLMMEGYVCGVRQQKKTAKATARVRGRSLRIIFERLAVGRFFFPSSFNGMISTVIS